MTTTLSVRPGQILLREVEGAFSLVVVETVQSGLFGPRIRVVGHPGESWNIFGGPEDVGRGVLHEVQIEGVLQ